MNEATDPYIQAMFGCNAIHVPFHGVVQRHGEQDGHEVVLCMFASRVKTPHPLMFGQRELHSFVHGDMVVRPMDVFVSNHCQGMGAAGIICSSSFARVDEWVRLGKTIIL